VSPEGKRISVGIGYEVWVVDLQRATRTRIAASDRAGIRALVPNTAWTPDGLRVTFNRQDTESENGSTMEWRQADAATPAEVLYRAAGIVVPGTWTRDGRTLAMLFAAGTTRDLWLLERSGANPARQWLAEPAFERAPAFSPDNRWIAYVSDDSGQDQVYLQSYPKPGPRQIVSNDGGTEPVWARDGREVYYRSGDRMMAVSVQDTPSLVLGQSRVLFDAPYQRDTSSLRGVPHYDVSADGRFLMVTPLSPDRVVVVLNWQEELKQRVPTR
jgi:serine/threonine-protein kinase